MIVLEGCDCAGKTTIARELARRLLASDKLRRFEAFGLMPTWWDYSYMYVASCKPWSVIDRFIISEFVYGKLWRDGPNIKLTNSNCMLVREAMFKVGALTVYVRPPMETVLRRMELRGEKLLKPSDVPMVYALFDRYLSMGLHRVRVRVQFPAAYPYLLTSCSVTQTPVVIVDGEDLKENVSSILQAYDILQEGLE